MLYYYLLAKSSLSKTKKNDYDLAKIGAIVLFVYLNDEQRKPKGKIPLKHILKVKEAHERKERKKKRFVCAILYC